MISGEPKFPGKGKSLLRPGSTLSCSSCLAQLSPLPLGHEKGCHPARAFAPLLSSSSGGRVKSRESVDLAHVPLWCPVPPFPDRTRDELSPSLCPVASHTRASRYHKRGAGKRVRLLSIDTWDSSQELCWGRQMRDWETPVAILEGTLLHRRASEGSGPEGGMGGCLMGDEDTNWPPF